MKQSFTILFLLIAGCCFAQQATHADSIAMYTSFKTNIPQKHSIDSFSFCSITYKVPRDCDKRSQKNCCGYTNNPDQLGCSNGVTLSWNYFKTEEMAKSHFESVPNQMEKQMKHFKLEHITCYLKGTKVNAGKMSGETREGAKWNCIFTYGIINDQVVFVELSSVKPIKTNKDIQVVMQQILRLAE